MCPKGIIVQSMGSPAAPPFFVLYVFSMTRFAPRDYTQVPAGEHHDLSAQMAVWPDVVTLRLGTRFVAFLLSNYAPAVSCHTTGDAHAQDIHPSLVEVEQVRIEQ